MNAVEWLLYGAVLDLLRARGPWVRPDTFLACAFVVTIGRARA
jgi:hypothetical protein